MTAGEDIQPGSASRPRGSEQSLDEQARTRVKPQASASRSRRCYELVKPALEWPASLVLLVAALPIFGVTILLVKLTSPGPVFYSQVRLGRGGSRFRIYKLRTMTHNCEATTGPVWSLANDPRITPIGRWLRDTHLDELPQLWNVLRGDMSLVGPRPERPELAARIERALPQFRERLLVRPGITGLAQVRLPADADLGTVERKLNHDLHYIRTFGLLLDARIALATFLQLLGVAAGAMSRQLVQRHVPAIEHPLMLKPLAEDADAFDAEADLAIAA